jgi:hypothetical protein
LITNGIKIVSAALDTIHTTLIDVRNDRGSIMTISTIDSDDIPDGLNAADDKSEDNQDDKIPADDIWTPSIHLDEHSIWTAGIVAENDVSVR